MAKDTNLNPNKADKMRNDTPSAAAKAALAILGVGFVAGTTLVVGVDQIMKKFFVNDKWEQEEWSKDDWADEDLEN